MTDRRLLRAAVVLMMIAGGAGASAATPGSSSAPGDGIRDFPYLRVAGDLDADGLPDAMSVEYTPPTADIDGVASIGGLEQLVTARRGASGSVLWSKTLEGAIYPARIGSVGSDGFISAQGPTVDEFCPSTCVWASTGLPGGILVTTKRSVAVEPLILTAVGPDGTEVWTRRFEPLPGAHVLAESPTADVRASRAEDEPAFAGLLRGPGGVTDVLVSLADRTELADQVQATTTVLVLEGKGGQTRVSIDFTSTGPQPSPRPAGDLDGDGVDDFVVAHAAGSGSLAAFDGRDGSPLWTIPGPLVLTNFWILPVRDVDGDGRGELVLLGIDDIFDDEPAPLRLLDGATGAVRLSVEADTLVPVGDLDGDGVLELLTQGVSSLDSNSSLISYRLLDLGGNVLASREYTAARKPGESSIHVELRTRLGDLDEDGFEDVGHVVVGSSEGQARRDGLAISGRTLAPAFEGLAGEPVLASLGGQAGDDLMLVSAGGSSASIVATAQDGASGAPIWTAQLPVDPDLDLKTLQARVESADVNGDGTADLLLSAQLARPEDDDVPPLDLEPGPWAGRPAWVLDGRDGRLIWGV